MTTDRVVVRMEHVRKAKMCSDGARGFFKRHNLDWCAFLKHGIDSKLLIETGDAMALKVVKVAIDGR